MQAAAEAGVSFDECDPMIRGQSMGGDETGDSSPTIVM